MTPLVTRWEPIIRDAALARFYKTGDAGPFLLARADLVALICQVDRSLDPDTFGGPGFVRVQVRVYVPELTMQIMVDEWVEQ